MLAWLFNIFFPAVCVLLHCVSRFLFFSGGKGPGSDTAAASVAAREGPSNVLSFFLPFFFPILFFIFLCFIFQLSFSSRAALNPVLLSLGVGVVPGFDAAAAKMLARKGPSNVV